MSKGKNKKVPKKDKANKKGEKHPFSRKEWYNLISPAAVQTKKPIGWTCCKKPQGTQVVSDFLKGRIAEMAYSDITGNSKDVCKRLHVIVDEIQGANCFTNFYKYELTRDKISGMLRKRQTLIEINTEVKSEDGTILRVFLVVVSKKLPNQTKLNSYVKHSVCKILRKKMIPEIQSLASKSKCDNFIYDVLTESLQKKLEKLAVKVIPGCMLQVIKIKCVKRGVVDTKKLTEDFVEAIKQTEEKEKTEENPEAQNQLTKE